MISVTNKATQPLRARAGFTFIELLIVIVIIGILAGVSLPKFRSTFATFELENFVKDIFYLCRYLQASAIAEAKIYHLAINKEAKEFQAEYQEHSELKKVEGRFGKAYKAPQAVEITTAPDDKNEIYFYPDASTDKITIYFTDRADRKLSLVIQGASGGIQIK